MKNSIHHIEAFIKKIYKSFIGVDVEINIIKNELEISSEGIVFSIKLLEKFILDHRFEKVVDTNFKTITSKLLIILNTKFYIPLDIKLGKKDFHSSKPSIFTTSLLDGKSSLSEEFISIIQNSEYIYSNDIAQLKSISDINIIGNLRDIKTIQDCDIPNNVDITIVYFGDVFSSPVELSFLYELFPSKQRYTFSADSHFINHYALSVAHYGSLFFGGAYNIDTYSKHSTQKNIEIFFQNIGRLLKKSGEDSMFYQSSFAVSLHNYSCLELFINTTKNILESELYSMNIIFETQGGYYSVFNKVEVIDISVLQHENNICNISVFLFKNSENIPNNSKFHSCTSPKTITYLSAPLAKTTEFRYPTIEKIQSSKYIFGESLDGIRGYFDKLHIEYDDKELFFGDDLILLREYEKSIPEGVKKHELIPEVLPELVDLLQKNKKITFLSDGGVPCILDPGDYIKKYILTYFPEYSVVGYTGPNVLSTILLGVAFEYEHIFWTPLIYSLRPALNILIENETFSSAFFTNSITILYSFASEIDEDIIALNKIFTPQSQMQIFGDIGTEYEYNRVTTLGEYTKKYYKEVHKKSDNIVYVLKK